MYMGLFGRRLAALRKARAEPATEAWVREKIAEGGGGSVAWSDVTGKPSTFTPSAHTHVSSDISGFDAAVAATPAVTANTAKVSNATHTGDVTGSTALTIAAKAVSLSKMADLTTSTILGRVTAGSGTPEALTPAQVRTLLNVADGANNYSHPNHSGDVTSSGDGSTTIANDAVTNAKLANMATATIKGRTTAGTGDPEDLTGAQVTAMLDAFTSGAKGLVPASGGGTTNFLRADGTFAAPSGGGGSTVYYGHLQSDYTLTNTTAVQKLFNWSTNGGLTLPTGIYRFRCMIYLTTMSGTSGNGSFRLKGGGTATLARILYHVNGIDNTSPLNAGTQTGSASITENSVASMVTAATGTGLTAIVEGFFDVTVTGTIIPSIALVTAAAAIVKAGSFFECERVADTAAATSGGWT